MKKSKVRELLDEASQVILEAKAIVLNLLDKEKDDSVKLELLRIYRLLN